MMPKTLVELGREVVTSFVWNPVTVLTICRFIRSFVNWFMTKTKCFLAGTFASVSLLRHILVNEKR
jgi:hypothetical protein